MILDFEVTGFGSITSQDSTGGNSIAKHMEDNHTFLVYMYRVTMGCNPTHI